MSGTNCSTGTATTYIWTSATDAKNGPAAMNNNLNSNTGFANHNDWRVPTQRELGTLLTINVGSISINTTIFPNTQNFNNGFYWTSSQFLVNKEKAWASSFGYGGTYSDLRDASLLSNNYHVRLVRTMYYFASYFSLCKLTECTHMFIG